MIIKSLALTTVLSNYRVIVLFVYIALENVYQLVKLLGILHFDSQYTMLIYIRVLWRLHLLFLQNCILYGDYDLLTDLYC